jgi:hypothetical protein
VTGGAEVPETPLALDGFAERLAPLNWVTDIWVGGSLATGDYTPYVSDLDLVALTDGPVDPVRRNALTALHRALDRTDAAGLDLGCTYVDAARLADPGRLHPTWTHGELVERVLSGVSRAELVRHGFAVRGRPPADLLPPMSDDDVRDAAREELSGYWSWAARQTRLWLNPVMPDLGLTSMARGRHALATGRLLTKTEAIATAAAPDWLLADLSARRRGEDVRSPRLRSAWIARRDVRRTVATLRS